MSYRNISMSQSKLYLYRKKKIKPTEVMLTQSLCQYRIATLKISFSVRLIVNFEKKVILEFKTLTFFDILDILFLSATKVSSLLDCKITQNFSDVFSFCYKPKD